MKYYKIIINKETIRRKIKNIQIAILLMIIFAILLIIVLGILIVLMIALKR